MTEFDIVKEIKNKMITFFKNHNQEDIGERDTSRVIDMTAMFNKARSFNQPLDQWNTERVTTIQSMYEDSISFVEEINLDTPRLENDIDMFSGSAVSLIILFSFFSSNKKLNKFR